MAVVYILTRGGPFNSTQMLPMWAFQTGIQAGALGAGAAVALFLLPILARRDRADAALRAQGRGHVSARSRTRDNLVTYLVVGAVRDRARVPVLLDALDLAEDRPGPLQHRERPVRLRAGLADARTTTASSSPRPSTLRWLVEHRARRAWSSSLITLPSRCRPATRSRGSRAAGVRASASASSSSTSCRRRCSSCRSRA